MAKPHWTIPDEPGRHGCQYSTCVVPALHQWQREATQQEIDAEQGCQGPYGELHRSPLGPHRVAVFACADHALGMDAAARNHNAECLAPDEGCACSG